MADEKKKGFDLGKSGDSAPGFDLNKEASSQPEPKKGFDLGKSGDEAPGFNLNKESAESPQLEPSKGFALGKGDKEAPSAFDLGKGDAEAAPSSAPKKEAIAEKQAGPVKDAPKAEAKAPEKEKEAAAPKKAAAEKKAEPAKAAPKADTKAPAKEKEAAAPKPAAADKKAEPAKTAPQGKAASAPKEAPAEKKSKAPMLMLGLALLLAAAYFLIPGGDGGNDIEADLGDAATPTEIQGGNEVSGMDGESNEDPVNGSESSSNDGLNTSVAGDDTDESGSEGSSSTSESSDSDDGSDLAATGEEASSNGASSEDNSMGDVASSDEAESSNTADETADEGSATESQPVTNSSSTSDGNISFAKNSTRVNVANSQINAIRTYLSENPNSNLIIEGHASSEGDRFYNIGLSRRRAQAVKDELVRGGVDADRIKVVAQGSKYPVADNSTESGRAQNRRVELKYE